MSLRASVAVVALEPWHHARRTDYDNDDYLFLVLVLVRLVMHRSIVCVD